MKTLNLTLTLLPFLLAGCAAMSVEECQVANWAQVGEQDGQLGNSNRLASYYKSCEKVGIQPNQQLYNQAYQQGLKRYCQPAVIFDKSLTGSGNYSVCPIEQHAVLRPYYDVGSAYYAAKREKKQLEDDLERYQGYLLDKKLSQEKRNNYIDKIRALKDDYRTVERDYAVAKRDLERFKRERRLP